MRRIIDIFSSKKIISGTLALVLGFGLIAGCGTGGNDVANSGDNNDPDTEVNGDNNTGGEQTEFDIVTVRWSDWGDDFLQGFVEETEEAAGINVNWDVQLNADWGDKRATLMAGGDLPDAFWGSNAFDDASISVNKEYFIPLEDYINEDVMPNLTRAMEEDPQMRTIATDLDGHIYGLPKKESNRPIVSNQLFINQTWLDNLGLDMPTNLDEFLDVLRAFRDEDANGNGNVSDEIPYAAGYSDTVYAFILPFGVVDKDGLSATSFKIVDNEPVYNVITEEYREGIKFMHEAFAEGLIDAEIFTQDGSLQDSKLQNTGDTIVGVSSGWTPDAVFAQHADQYVPMEALEGPSGESYVFSGQTGYQYARNEVLITTQAEDPETLLRWIDQFYTEDASIQTLYGSFGVGVEKNDDGTYTVLAPENPDESADTYAWIHSFRDFGPKYVSDDFNEKVTYETTESGDGQKLELSQVVEHAAKPEMAFPDVMFTNDELDRLSVLGVDLGNYVVTTRAAWITEGGVDEGWDSYLEELNRMGLEEYLEIHNTAYNRYLEIAEEAGS